MSDWQGHETSPNGLCMRDAVIGWDLNNGRGFNDFAEAKLTWDYDNPPYRMLFKVRGEVYQVIKVLGKPVFDFFDKDA